MRAKTATLFAALIIGASAAHGALPIEIRYGVGRNRAAMKLWTTAEEELKKGEVENAKEHVNAALRSDPTLWPALYTRAKVYMREGKFDLAVQDCSAALQQYPPFIEAALLRADANLFRRRYPEALKEINHCVAIHPRSDALGRAFAERAWLRATCPDPAFRNGQEAVKDATKACKLLLWQDEFAVEALAAAYAETGDFESAVRYGEQGLAIKDISTATAERFRRAIALFKLHQPIRLSR